MSGGKIQFRKPIYSDVDGMFKLLNDSLSPFTIINENVSGNNQLILSRDVVSEYISDERYFSIIAQIDHAMVGWLSGSGQSEVLLAHKCTEGQFYIEEIVVHPSFRRLGIGISLLNSIPIDGVKALVVDTPRINDSAVAFYKKIGFIEVLGLSDDFTSRWIRLSKSL